MSKVSITQGNAGASKGLHLLSPPYTLEVMRGSSAGLVEKHGLARYEGEMTRKLRKGFSHFLSPYLQTMVKEKPRIMLAEKAEFAELLSEELSGRPIKELPLDLLRRSFTIRRRVGPPPADDSEAVPGRPPIPPDVPSEEQTTNKLSAAYKKKQAKRARPPEDEAPSTGQQPAAFRAILKPFIAKLMQMKWTGWNNPFSTVLTKKNAPPRYFDFIKRPMNLTYIRDNLTKNKYYTLAEVEADLDLIVSNALTFNRPIDPVYQFALELQAAYRAELPHLRRALRSGSGGAHGNVPAEKKPRVR